MFLWDCAIALVRRYSFVICTRSFAHLAATSGFFQLMVSVTSPVLALLVTTRTCFLKNSFAFHKVGILSGLVTFHFPATLSHLSWKRTGSRPLSLMYFSVSASDCRTANDSAFLESPPTEMPVSEEA